MTQKQTPQQQAQSLTPDEQKVMQQSQNQDEERALQEGLPGTDKAVQQNTQPRYPNWPTSKPGPLATQPLPGQRPINAIRSEQVAEIGYNQVTGEPSSEATERSMPDAPVKELAGFDHLQTANGAQGPRRRKERL